MVFINIKGNSHIWEKHFEYINVHYRILLLIMKFICDYIQFVQLLILAVFHAFINNL